MALAQDILTRIVRIVRSRGAVFIVTTNQATQYCIKVRGSGAAPTILPITLPDGPDGAGTITQGAGSSYKRIDGVPTFVLCGNLRYNMTVGDRNYNIWTSYVYTSNNGIDWRFTFTAPFYVDINEFGRGVPSQSWGTAFVWSGSAFHYDFIVERDGLPAVLDPEGDPRPWKHEHIFHSNNGNGSSWAGDDVGQSFDEHMDYRSPFPPTYCTHHNCIDPVGQNVPDGTMEALRAITMRPKFAPPIFYSVAEIDFQGHNDFFPFTPSPIVQVISADGTVDRTVPGFQSVTCVAGANNIWMAGGMRPDEGPALALSFNNGANWTALAFEEGSVSSVTSVLSISAAPMTDIPGA
jgi:hypothetical protein